MDDDAMGMRWIPSPYGHPLVSAVIIVAIGIKGVAKAVARVAKAGIAIVICRITGAKEGKEAKADKDVAMVAVVRFGG